MIAIQQRFQLFLVTAGIVLSAVLGGCGGGAESTTAVDGTTIMADSPSVSNIYISTSASSNKQSNLSFTVTKKGAPQANIGITVTLNEQAKAAGVIFFGGGTTLSLTTDSSGKTPVFSIVAGNIPTSVVVKGSLSTNSLVVDYSTAITVSSGSPVQDRFSIAIEENKQITESWSNITQLKLAAYVADRLGNPVPDGTLINFSASAGGTVTSSCTTTNSTCPVDVTLNRGTNTNPFVTVIGYATGEESFTDNNGNNKYDVGEVFVDLGNFYRDDNVNNVYNLGIDQPFTTASSGSAACPSSPASLLNQAATCDGLWSGSNLIRTQVRLYMAETALSIHNFSYAGNTFTASFQVSGSVNGGQPPAQTKVEISFPTLPSSGTASTCTAGTLSNTPTLSNIVTVTQPSNHSVVLNAACSGQAMQVKTTTPSNAVQIASFTIP